MTNGGESMSLEAFTSEYSGRSFFFSGAGQLAT